MPTIYSLVEIVTDGKKSRMVGWSGTEKVLEATVPCVPGVSDSWSGQFKFIETPDLWVAAKDVIVSENPRASEEPTEEEMNRMYEEELTKEANRLRDLKDAWIEKILEMQAEMEEILDAQHIVREVA